MFSFYEHFSCKYGNKTLFLQAKANKKTNDYPQSRNSAPKGQKLIA